MGYNYDCVGLDRIDTANTFYQISTAQDKASLEASICRVGLICPVILQQIDQNLSVVSGFRRVEACRRLRWQTIPCRVLPQDISPIQCAEIAITDNVSRRSLNIIEQARCLRLVERAGKDAAVSPEMATLLGVPLNTAFIAKMRKVLAASETIQNSIIVGNIPLPVAMMLSELTPEDAEAVAAIFNTLPMGLNKQREILLHLNEISARDDIPVWQLLEEDGVQSILNGGDVDGNKKARSLRLHLRQRRYPRLVKIEQQFHEKIAALKLGKDIQIIPPTNFEGDTCNMTIRFSCMDDLKKARGKLSDIIDNPIALKLLDDEYPRATSS
jgi:ParB family chromosome partitioning protein